MVSMDPLELDWGVATVDSIIEDRKAAVHILNHDLGTVGAVLRSIRFARARVAWLGRHLPKGFQQVVAFDDRGQDLTVDRRQQLRQSLQGTGARVVFFSEGTHGVL